MKVKKGKSPSGICIFPRYKWCGPNCSGPGPPFNDVDKCCRAHDECLQNNSNCACDQAFIQCLRPKIKLTTEEGRIAFLMHAYMQIQTIFTCRNKN